jgi:hypothetical protein
MACSRRSAGTLLCPPGTGACSGLAKPPGSRGAAALPPRGRRQPVCPGAADLYRQDPRFFADTVVRRFRRGRKVYDAPCQGSRQFAARPPVLPPDARQECRKRLVLILWRPPLLPLSAARPGFPLGPSVSSRSLPAHGRDGPDSIRPSPSPHQGSSPCLSSLPADGAGNAPQKSPVRLSSLTSFAPYSRRTSMVFLARFLVLRHPYLYNRGRAAGYETLNTNQKLLRLT